MTRLAFLLAATLLAAAPARAQDESRIAARQVVEELDAWDVTSARAALNDLLRRMPDSPDLKRIDAEVLFEEGRYAESVALFDELGVAGGGTADLARATLAQTRGYLSVESEHFVFRHPPGKDALLAPYALEALEKAWAALKADLGYAPPNKVPVEVYENAEALAKVSTLPLEAIKTSGTIAICKFNRIMFTSPKALVKGYGWLDTLSHEYVHLVVSKKSRDRVPLWIHEGLAKYLQSRWRGPAGTALSPASAAFLAQELKKDQLIPFERMHPSMALLPSPEDAALAYAEVFTAIEFIRGKAGEQSLPTLIDELRSGADYQTAVSRAVGLPFGRFMTDWRAYLARREFPKEAIPLSAEKRRFKEDAARQPPKPAEKEREEIRFGDFLEIEDPEGRRLAHLGELLRVRRREKAAVHEFARAHARVGNRSPALSNRYAEALIKLGDLKRADELLTGSLGPFPEHPKTHLNLGQLYLATDRPELAEKAFLEVVGTDPFDPLPHGALAKIYADRQQTKLANREKAALAILAGKDPSLLLGKGAIVVRSHPYARVLLDGLETGRTTPTTLVVEPGTHVVKLINDERGFSHEAGVEVAEGEEKLIEVKADDQPATPTDGGSG